MSSLYPAQSSDTLPDKIAASDPRVREYVKSFQRVLRRRPTNLQKNLMWQAAAAQVRYADALNDPHIRPNDLEALERVARRAGNAMHASFKIQRDGFSAVGRPPGRAFFGARS